MNLSPNPKSSYTGFLETIWGILLNSLWARLEKAFCKANRFDGCNAHLNLTYDSLGSSIGSGMYQFSQVDFNPSVKTLKWGRKHIKSVLRTVGSICSLFWVTRENGDRELQWTCSSSSFSHLVILLLYQSLCGPLLSSWSSPCMNSCIQWINISS